MSESTETFNTFVIAWNNLDLTVGTLPMLYKTVDIEYAYHIQRR